MGHQPFQITRMVLQNQYKRAASARHRRRQTQTQTSTATSGAGLDTPSVGEPTTKVATDTQNESFSVPSQPERGSQEERQEAVSDEEGLLPQRRSQPPRADDEQNATRYATLCRSRTSDCPLLLCSRIEVKMATATQMSISNTFVAGERSAHPPTWDLLRASQIIRNAIALLQHEILNFASTVVVQVASPRSLPQRRSLTMSTTFSGLRSRSERCSPLRSTLVSLLLAKSALVRCRGLTICLCLRPHADPPRSVMRCPIGDHTTMRQDARSEMRWHDLRTHRACSSRRSNVSNRSPYSAPD